MQVRRWQALLPHALKKTTVTKSTQITTESIKNAVTAGKVNHQQPIFIQMHFAILDHLSDVWDVLNDVVKDNDVKAIAGT
jgi:uncharacterized protein YpiB (UPF0302 family)